MLSTIKSAIPSPIKKILYPVKQKTYDQWYKKRLFKQMQVKHTELLEQMKDKQKIKVVFLAIHESVWKVDPVFRKMLEDPFFEPEILVCPYTIYGEERMLEDMEQAYNYFIDKGYPVRKSRNEDGSWVKLSDIKPDIIFFTNPHSLTRKEYYEEAYMNYLSCYVPYYFMATKHIAPNQEYNNIFFAAVWKIYWPHLTCMRQHKKLSVNKGSNGICVGYPAGEILVDNKYVYDFYSWKEQNNNKRKIIFAPHHTIEDNKHSLSSFLKYADLMQQLAIANQDKAQWSFKPHPMLKSKLYLHPDWGTEKTNFYYNFWHSQSYTQLDEGEYHDLFLSSDAIIHDCSSFIVEYALTGKPSLYLINKNNLRNLLNDFGKSAMKTSQRARSVDDVETFIDEVINQSNTAKITDSQDFERYIHEYYQTDLPSERIINDLKQSIGNSYV